MFGRGQEKPHLSHFPPQLRQPNFDRASRPLQLIGYAFEGAATVVHFGEQQLLLRRLGLIFVFGT